MPIQSGDVKLLKSAVMADVPEGGGAPTGNVIADGVSNAIFPDISELDRAGGRVNLRKCFVSVQTDDVDTYLGGNMIVALPPQDERVSVTLFGANSSFDTRTQAAQRIESYLNQGPEWAGFLYENHIAGQRVVQFFQRPSAEVPNIGQTLVLIQSEGVVGAEKSQYVRATAIESELRFFFDASSGTDYEAAIVTVSISDALRENFTGSPASRSFARSGAGTKVRDTVIADAGTYVGVVPLTAAADLGDFTVSGESIFTQLVPSAQTETPIADVRSNGLANALVPAGAAVTLSMTLAFTTSQALFVGGPVYPGSLSIVRSGVTLTDSGGTLVSAGVQVGTVDYDNGIAVLLSNVFGATAGTHAVTFVPASAPELVSDQRAIPITPESRSLSYTFVLDDIPVPRTLSISFLAQGRWYTLRDDGSGVLRGNDLLFGAGTLNYSTGSVLITLGALPDVGSSLVIQSFSKSSTLDGSNTTLVNSGRVYLPFNTDSAVSEEKGSQSIQRSALSISWTDGTAKTAVDNGAGVITGDATGTVDYANGVVRLSPNVLPAAGTVFTATITARSSDIVSVSAGAGNFGATNIQPGSVAFVLPVTFQYAPGAAYLPSFPQRGANVNVTDDGVGGLRFLDSNNVLVACGTVNYTTGAFTLGSGGGALTVGRADPAGPTVSVPSGGALSGGAFTFAWNAVPYGVRTASFSVGASLSVSLSSVSGSSSEEISVIGNTYIARVAMVPNYTMRGASFALGSDQYRQQTDGTLSRNPSPTTGVGTPAGAASGPLGAVSITLWTTGATSLISDWRAVIAPPSTTLEAPFMSVGSIFRTAAAPLRPASLSVLGTMQDGTTFNVTAALDGTINGTRVKGKVDYQYGLISLYFVNPGGPEELEVDLSFLGIAGLGMIPVDLVQLNTIRYNAVAFSYLPLDADILGIDPVRLPTDGRVPIFRPGGFAVVGHTAEITATVSNAQTIDCARVRLSRVRVIGDDGVVINTGYTTDLEAGTVTFTDVSGYSQPVTIEHRIEDMGVVREVQINGEISFTRPLTHDYPLGSYVSSALIAGDLFARVPLMFDQASWNGTWADLIAGGAATGTFNSAVYPIEVSNRGAIAERWIVRFTNTTSFEVIGENVGVIAVGNTATDCSPINPSTSVPYFTIPALGWGAGWATGNALRFNTIGAQFPVWVVRTIQQGPESVPDDTFTLLIRGDVDQA